MHPILTYFKPETVQQAASMFKSAREEGTLIPDTVGLLVEVVEGEKVCHACFLGACLYLERKEWLDAQGYDQRNWVLPVSWDMPKWLGLDPQFSLEADATNFICKISTNYDAIMEACDGDA